jgi:pimeloyl-ACP methyl ester carboxylesterase
MSVSLQKSTIVRSFSMLDALGGPARDLAARLALLAFRWTPPRRPASLDERATLARAHRGRLDLGDATVPTWSWGEGPSVLLVHGWGGRGGQLHAFVDPLVAAGHRVTTFDAPGHGAASGRTSDVPTFARAVSAAAMQSGGLAGVVAHSLGAAATAWAIAGGARIDRIAFVSPVTRPGSFWSGFLDLLGLSPIARERATRRARETLGVTPDELALGRTLSSAFARTLIVHDEGDRRVPPGGSRALAAEHASLRLHLTAGLGHHRILRDPEVVARVTEFVANGERPSVCATPGCARLSEPGAPCCLEHQLSTELWDPSLRRASLRLHAHSQ